MDSIQLASAEADSWVAAQSGGHVNHEDPLAIPPVTRTETEPALPRCQVDASWGINCRYSGGGFVLETNGSEKVYGAFTFLQVISPLHAELAALTQAMKILSEQGLKHINFESDCQQLVKLVNEDELWPSLASELDEFTIYSFIF